MGIRELAAEAKAADEAAAKVEAKKTWRLNATVAENTVMNMLGIPGKATRAASGKTMPYGENSVVCLEPDLYVVVRTQTHYVERAYHFGGERQVDRYEPYLLLCDETGSTYMGGIDHKVTSLATLSIALTKNDAYLADKAERAARTAATKAAAKV